MSIRFGTDGWRAVISEEFTFANVRLVARAISDYVKEITGATGAAVVVGFDTRFLSDRYAMEVARCMADNDLQVYLSNSDCPTPAMAFAIQHLKAVGGVMVTASHNPPRYNGLKFKGYHGGPAMPEETRRIEQILERNLATGLTTASSDWTLSDGVESYPGITRFDPMPPYLAHIRTLVDLHAVRAASLKVAVDSMYGAGRGYISAILRDVGCDVVELHGEMNPGFGGIHPEPIERNLGDLLKVIREGHFDIGLATDGDADRIGAVDAQGRFVDPHRIFSLILHHLLETRSARGSVVKTVSTTQLLNKLCQRYGLPLHETPVGFNYICEWMLKEDVLMGGEESGGMTVRGHVPDGDGILMALFLIELLATQQEPLHEIVADLMREYGEFHYGRHDFHTRAFDKQQLTERLMSEAPERILHHRVVRVNNSDGVKYLLDDDSWLLIRPSGTEPLLRIYAEAHVQQEVGLLLAAGEHIADI